MFVSNQQTKGGNRRSKDVTPAQQQRAESPTVTLAWHANQYSEVQTHKRFKRTLFIRTKYNMRIFGVIPLSSYKTTLQQQLNGEKRLEMRWRAKPLICFGYTMITITDIYKASSVTGAPSALQLLRIFTMTIQVSCRLLTLGTPIVSLRNQFSWNHLHCPTRLSVA